MSRVLRFSRNTVGRDLIVGDVHGCFTKLRAALDAVRFDPAAGDRLFSVGDLVDRGPESDQVLDWLGQPWFHAIAGNHESMAVWYQAGNLNAQTLVMNGGGWFVGKTLEERQPFADAFAALPVAIELETARGLIGLVHADCPNQSWTAFTARLAMGGSPADTATQAAQWSRDRVSGMNDDDVAGVLAVVVGHTPMERPTTLGNVHFIDTGAWLQGGAAKREFCLLNAATLSPAFAPLPEEAAA